MVYTKIFFFRIRGMRLEGWAILNYLVFENKHLAFCKSMQYNKVEDLSKRCFLIVLFDHRQQII